MYWFKLACAVCSTSSRVWNHWWSDAADVPCWVAAGSWWASAALVVWPRRAAAVAFPCDTACGGGGGDDHRGQSGESGELHRPLMGTDRLAAWPSRENSATACWSRWTRARCAWTWPCTRCTSRSRETVCTCSDRQIVFRCSRRIWRRSPESATYMTESVWFIFSIVPAPHPTKNVCCTSQVSNIVL